MTKMLTRLLTAAIREPPPFHRAIVRTTADIDKCTDSNQRGLLALYEGWTGVRLTRPHPITTTITECQPVSQVEEEVAFSTTKAIPFTAIGPGTMGTV